MKPLLRRWSRLLHGLLVLAPSLTLTILWLGAPDERFHPDEEYWIGSAYYFYLAAKERDFSNPDWDLLPGRENHALGKYVLGLGLQAQGFEVRDIGILASFYERYRQRDPRFWGNSQDSAMRQAIVSRASPQLQAGFAQGQCPPLPRDLLFASRRLVFLFALSAVIAWQIIALRIGFPPWSQALAALWILHPVWQPTWLYATIDGLALTFGLWTQVFFLEWLRCKPIEARRSLSLALATGLFAAFACGAKLNNAIVLLAITLAALLDIRLRPAAEKKLKLRELLISTFFGAAVFILSNPTLIHDPAGGVLDLWLQYSRISEVLEAVFGPRLQSIPQRFQAISQLSFGSIILAFLAILVLLFETTRWSSQSSSKKALLLWLWLALALLLLWIPFPVDRYVLPFIPPLSLASLIPIEGGLQSILSARSTSGDAL